MSAINAAPLASLYVDLDHDQLPDTIAVPTVTVESSPGKYQCYWRLTSPVAPAAGAMLNRQLAQATGADKTSTLTSRSCASWPSPDGSTPWRS